MVTWTCVAATLLLTQPLAAEDSATLPGPSASGLRGLPNAGAPIGRRELTLRLTAGYGLTESRKLLPSATHRLQGGLAASVSPLDWLGFGLRLDGRLELHGDDGRGSHMSGFGDPRLYARAGYALDPEWSIGGELLAWFPGTEAPSFVAGASSVDARVLAAYQPLSTPISVFASAGVRVDNSSQNATARDRTRPSDIMTLGVSDSNAILAALGALYRVDPAWQVFGELSGDILVGSKAPRFSDSPLRATAGARWQLTQELQAEGTAVVALSTRPSLRAAAPWVPTEPRFMILLGLSYTWTPFTPTVAPEQQPEGEEIANKPVEDKPVLKLASLQGVIIDERGQPVPDVRVTLVAADGTQLEAITDADGKYQFERVPYGQAKLEARAVGFAKQSWQAEVNGPKIKAEAPTALEQAVDVGVLRGLVRSFDSKPLVAHVVINDNRGKLLQERNSGADGRFEFELPPGQYKVSIEAAGFKKHAQSIRIKGNGVSVLNADMQAQ
ncbi:MAG TPA: carboxypeptidase-like regulatory domain-containing protein [Polyangiales bacterium]|nr:carboxypeptidase-like regulatory domain-containing protein [Polyangiales bacterium]